MHQTLVRMQEELRQWIDTLRTGFWLVPSIMLFTAIGLAAILLHLDVHLDPGIKSHLFWAYSGGPESARSLLSTVAGSLITAASVTVSLASVALSIASQQYGSRVLRNFMRDSVTQVMLGIFVATFLYSVLIVRSIRGSDYGGFVPAISITVGILLTLVSLLSLVYFIHHVSESIQASHIINSIAIDTEKSIHNLYPSSVGEPRGEADLKEIKLRDVGSIAFTKSGYIRSIILSQLSELARKRDVVLEVVVAPGDFVLPGQVAAYVYSSQPLTGEEINDSLGAFLLGGERTPIDDIRYQFQQLTDIVVRALSPGINDPFTAINGIDRMTSALVQIARRPRPSAYRFDEDGHLLLVAHRPGLGDLLRETIAHISIYAAGDRFVMAGLYRALAILEPDLRTDDERSTLLEVRGELSRREATEAP
ncbi:MAG: DUF2254 domain-containing protein [Edaphobacter sp.]